MERFPEVRERRIPFGGAVKTSIQEDIHCICRMPYNKATDMIQCSSCLVWFHSVCIDISNVKAMLFRFSRKPVNEAELRD